MGLCRRLFLDISQSVPLHPRRLPAIPGVTEHMGTPGATPQLRFKLVLSSSYRLEHHAGGPKAVNFGRRPREARTTHPLRGRLLLQDRVAAARPPCRWSSSRKPPQANAKKRQTHRMPSRSPQARFNACPRSPPDIPRRLGREQRNHTLGHFCHRGHRGHREGPSRRRPEVRHRRDSTIGRQRRGGLHPPSFSSERQATRDERRPTPIPNGPRPTCGSLLYALCVSVANPLPGGFRPVFRCRRSDPPATSRQQQNNPTFQDATPRFPPATSPVPESNKVPDPFDFLGLRLTPSPTAPGAIGPCCGSTGCALLQGAPARDSQDSWASRPQS
jgi:hypothetical protein